MKTYAEKHSHKGEIMDSTPIQVPTKFRRSMTLQDQIRLMIRRDMSRLAQQNGHETWEEADDFDVDDDPELKSPYELDDELNNPPFDDRRHLTATEPEDNDGEDGRRAASDPDQAGEDTPRRGGRRAADQDADPAAAADHGAARDHAGTSPTRSGNKDQRRMKKA